MKDYTEQEIAKRRDDAIRRALGTPPKPLKEVAGKSERSTRRDHGRSKKKSAAKPDK
jgi:hypothetical protein